ncbi:SusC/RagA family TonB-linked outer membrane protein [Chitinophaga qingshengii]|uniref:TonB-dependent receptor n=1 Tax=Chitinophaga qingshengii TaxID=1569794 RepID=A0ABR7TWJ4_9BACT|nr:TonB-dependent receptor [Chitinophaga qingshengii]MBC9934849.1 TonB-dependent receptor [Chitinophaga qingshengii]
MQTNGRDARSGITMSLAFLWLLTALLLQSTTMRAQQQQQQFSLRFEKQSLEQALVLLRSKTNASIAFNKNEVDGYTIAPMVVTGKTPEQILRLLVKDLPMDVLQKGTALLLKKKTAGLQEEAPKPTQEKTKPDFSGTITDLETGDPIPGAVVRVGGKSVVTKEGGEFSFQLSPGQYDVTVSHVSYNQQHSFIEVNGKRPVVLNLPMEITNSKLNEVVVVGYGSQRKVTLTGAVSSIKTKEIKQSAVSNLSNALVGRLPGLIARQSSGEPGANGSALFLRGKGTFAGSTSPLIMIDGVPRDGFEYIDPNEVESITILKDASATAIYGVRGANGVVLVTTRRGSDMSKPRVQLNVERAVQKPANMMKYLNSKDYFTLYREGLINDGRTADAAIYTDEYISRYDKSLNWPDSLEYDYLYPDVDWVDYMLKKQSPRTTVNLNVSGGNAKVRYFISGSYLDEGGIYAHTSDADGYDPQAWEKRFNFRSNVDIQISPWLRGELNLSTVVRKQNYPGPDAKDYFVNLRLTPSYISPVFNPDGSYAEVTGTNPYAQLVAKGYKRYYKFRQNGTAGVTADLRRITKGLSARVRFSYDAYNAGGFSRSTNYYSYTYQGQGNYQLKSTGQDFLNYETNTDGWSTVINPEFFVNYDRAYGKHNFSGLLLYRFSSKSERSDDAVGALPYRDQGVVSRIAYGYADKYFAEANFGYNGSENFAKGRRFGFFPSVSAAWVVSKEPFMAGTSKWLDLLKIRLSAGKVGNQDPGTRFAYQGRWNLSAGSYTFGDNYQNKMSTATEAVTGNPEVTWETALKYNAGLEVGLLDGFLSFTGDVFYEHRTGVYMNSAAMASGLMGLVTFPKINAGVVDNKGLELELTHRRRLNKNWYYEVKGMYTFAKNKIVDYLEVPMPERPWQSRIGRQINDIYTYISQGYFQSKEDIAKAASQSQFGVLQPGDIRYLDVNGDGVIDSYDQSYTGKNGEPTQIIGLSSQVQFKGFDLAMLFQGALGRWTSIRGYTMFGSNYEFRQIIEDYKGNYWTPDNPNAKYPRLMSQKNDNNTMASTHYLRSGDYLRLKNLEIGYTLPQRFTKRMKVAQTRIYANGNNLVTWDKLKLYDPEENDGSPTYPLMRTFNFGLSITF